MQRVSVLVLVMRLLDTPMKVEWPEGSMARAFAELAVRQRQFGRVWRADPGVAAVYRLLRRILAIGDTDDPR